MKKLGERLYTGTCPPAWFVWHVLFVQARSGVGLATPPRPFGSSVSSQARLMPLIGLRQRPVCCVPLPMYLKCCMFCNDHALVSIRHPTRPCRVVLCG